MVTCKTLSEVPGLNPPTPTSRATRGSSPVLGCSWGAQSWTACRVPAACVSHSGRGRPAPPRAGEPDCCPPQTSRDSQPRLALRGLEGHDLSREALGHAVTERTQGSQGRAGLPPQEMPAPPTLISALGSESGRQQVGAMRERGGHQLALRQSLAPRLTQIPEHADRAAPSPARRHGNPSTSDSPSSFNPDYIFQV